MAAVICQLRVDSRTYSLLLKAPRFWQNGLLRECELKNFINGIGDFVVYVNVKKLRARYGDNNEHGLSWLTTRRLNNDTGSCTTATDFSSRGYSANSRGIWITGPHTQTFCSETSGRKFTYFTVENCKLYSKHPPQLNRELIATYELTLDKSADRFKVHHLLEQLNGGRPRCRYNAFSLAYFN
ncbi:hypothetical protein CRM22_008953 [Opisthorchis felineus]|uniref:Uncharacterized protein n=1 Tax=Opisthorchis felineus TaxID=147828 RepID=A0A4S2LGU1_OPIFE|nr:hypothetical protein CRM22_008953 [Opisthorchis felineus]